MIKKHTPNQKTFHVLIHDQRTTVTIDTVLVDLYCIKNSLPPETTQGWTAVRDWIQELINEVAYKDMTHVSQWIRQHLIIEIIDSRLREDYNEWRFKV